MFVKMHRIITQKTCHLFSATLSEWLRVSQLIIRERIDSSESQNEPLWCEEISLTVFGWAVFTLQRGGVGTPLVLAGAVRAHASRCLWTGAYGGCAWHLEQQLEIFQQWQNFSWNYQCAVSFCGLLSLDKQRLWFQFWGRKEQSASHSPLKLWELGQANSSNL